MEKGGKQRPKRFLGKMANRSFSYLMVLPAVILFTFFAVYPFLEGVKLGFYRWDGLSPMTFIGMENYSNILHDEQYWSAIKNTFLYAVVTTIAKNVLGADASHGNDENHARKRLFSHYYIYAGHIFLCGCWHSVAVDFHPNFGLLNNFLRLIGADSLIMGWLSDSRIAIYSVMMVDVWRWAGFHMVLYLAGLQAISKDYYEAAEIDGAGFFAKFSR